MEHKTSEATTEQATGCKRRRSCRQARTELFAACCLRRSQSAQGATGKRKRREGAHQRQRSKRQRSEPAHRQAQEQTLFGAQNERGDYAAGRRLQRRRSCRKARTEEFAACCLRRSQSAQGATGKRMRTAGAYFIWSHGQAQKDGRSTSASAQQALAQRASTPTA